MKLSSLYVSSRSIVVRNKHGARFPLMIATGRKVEDQYLVCGAHSPETEPFIPEDVTFVVSGDGLKGYRKTETV